MSIQLLTKMNTYLLFGTSDFDTGLPNKSVLHDVHIGVFDFWLLLLLVLFLLLFILVALLINRIKEAGRHLLRMKDPKKIDVYDIQTLQCLDGQQVERVLRYKKKQQIAKRSSLLLLLFSGLSFAPIDALAQGMSANMDADSMWSKAGIIITMVLLAVPVILAVVLLFVKISRRLMQLSGQVQAEEAERIAKVLRETPLDAIEDDLRARQAAADYRLPADLLSGQAAARDEKGLIQIDEAQNVAIVSRKKKAVVRPRVEPELAKLVIWYLVSATFWLLFGTTVGEYLGVKFVAPDMEQLSWLSFGRLRPVHTNAVFWGWASLAMIGLAYYVVPRVSNVGLYRIRWGWCTLLLINLSVISGTVTLMAGINNGGGEYREYIWPVMLPFAIGLVLTLLNFYKTIAKRTTREIYIANWYIVSAIIFSIVIVLVAYLPFWQHGLGETIVQGYYMHQGVGMWFMLFTLGLVYYFLPQQLNKPIYSYSLGILAFWTQILFYTLIGSHHFVFSSIPWWLQTVAIVGSAGMAIPVIAGTTNFLMTFKNAWYKVGESYTLPFFLVGIIFYFTGSMQGTAEAFRETNLIWHFTDFTVAHSHLTMYGIICFLLWACIYAIVPRFTGKEAPQITVGAHFWLALFGLMFYTVPLMYGSTLKGIMWLESKPFIEGVTFMAPYWLWRAIGGSLMWVSHIFFAYNMYKMLSIGNESVPIGEAIVRKLEDSKVQN